MTDHFSIACLWRKSNSLLHQFKVGDLSSAQFSPSKHELEMTEDYFEIK